jgi:hypothetical protein
VAEVGVDVDWFSAAVPPDLDLFWLAAFSIFDKAVGFILLRRAERGRARLPSEIIFQIDEVTVNLAYGTTTENSQFHAAFITIFIFLRI